MNKKQTSTINFDFFDLDQLNFTLVYFSFPVVSKHSKVINCTYSNFFNTKMLTYPNVH